MKRASSLQLRRGGILQVSTWLILAGGALGLAGCDSSEHQARETRTGTEAESTQVTSEIDRQRDQLLSGEVPNNFHIPDIGYYHAAARDFYDTPYNEERDGKWFVNNAWADAPGPDDVPASRPSPEVLTRIDEALDKQQQSLQATDGGTGATPQAAYSSQSAYSSTPAYHSSSHNHLGSAMLMYWMLSGNRGYYSPGPGFSSFGQRAPMWESAYRSQRAAEVRSAGGSTSRSMTSRSTGSTSHASAGEGEHQGSAAKSAKPSAPSTRGGFGSTGSSGSSGSRSSGGSSSGGGSSSS